MEKIGKAVKMAIDPLVKQIKALTDIIMSQTKEESNPSIPPTRIILSQQDNQSPTSLGGRRGLGLSGQGRPNYAQKVAANVPCPMSQANEKVIFEKPINMSQPNPIKNPAYSLARRCLGFSPITSKDIDKYSSCYPELTNPEERFQKLGKDCVKDFLYQELDLSETVAGDIRIKSVFYPASGIASGILYAEFQSEGEVEMIKKNAKYLRTTNNVRAKLHNYVPKSLFNRYRAVEEKAFQIRSGDRTMATRVWINGDFELRKRKKGDTTPWSLITPEILLNLPPQDPKTPKMYKDFMDYQTPPTPMWENMRSSDKTFESVNNFNLLREEECI